MFAAQNTRLKTKIACCSEPIVAKHVVHCVRGQSASATFVHRWACTKCAAYFAHYLTTHPILLALTCSYLTSKHQRASLNNVTSFPFLTTHAESEYARSNTSRGIACHTPGTCVCHTTSYCDSRYAHGISHASDENAGLVLTFVYHTGGMLLRSPGSAPACDHSVDNARGMGNGCASFSY